MLRKGGSKTLARDEAHEKIFDKKGNTWRAGKTSASGAPPREVSDISRSLRALIDTQKPSASSAYKQIVHAVRTAPLPSNEGKPAKEGKRLQTTAVSLPAAKPKKFQSRKLRDKLRRRLAATKPKGADEDIVSSAGNVGPEFGEVATAPPVFAQQKQDRADRIQGRQGRLGRLFARQLNDAANGASTKIRRPLGKEERRELAEKQAQVSLREELIQRWRKLRAVSHVAAALPPPRKS